MMEKFTKVFAGVLLVAAILLVCKFCKEPNEAKSVELYSQNYNSIEKYTSDNYIIDVVLDERVTIIPRSNSTEQPKSYSWAHVIYVDFGKEEVK